MTLSPESIKAAEAMIERVCRVGGYSSIRLRGQSDLMWNSSDTELMDRRVAEMVNTIALALDAARREERDKSKLDPVIAAEWDQLQKFLADVPGDFLLHKVEALRAIEREACHAIPDLLAKKYLALMEDAKSSRDKMWLHDMASVPRAIADAIRARGEVQP